MAKNLSDFTLECNLNGWHCKKKSGEIGVYVGGNAKFYRAGQKFTGDQITARMVQACDPPVDTFVDKKSGKTTQVLTVMGGTAEELREAFEDYQSSLQSKTAGEVVVPEMTPDPEVDPEEEKKTKAADELKEKKEEKKKEKKEPRRTPRPRQ